MKVSRNVLFGLVVVLTNVFFFLLVSTELRYGKDARSKELLLHHPKLLSKRRHRKHLVELHPNREQRRKIRESVDEFRGRQQLRNATTKVVVERPPLDSIIDQYGNITANSQFLLDFAIIGFGKCGTSTMLQWLSSHPFVECIPEEVWELMHSRPHALIRRLYDELPAGQEFQRGYKCPGDITQPHILKYFETLWPQTKLFIGIRHPVRWFESLYNFRLQNLKSPKDTMKHPNELIGRCFAGMRLTCTEKGNFAYNLLQTGKHLELTRRPRLEEAIVGRFDKTWYNVSNVPILPNPIFLFDVSQLGDTNQTRLDLLRHDVQTYLGLQEELPPLLHANKIKGSSNNIDICDDEYQPAREDLMHIARLNSKWIRHVFLNSPSVYYSSRDHLEEILKTWMYDPCETQEDESE